jgi:hypothetical protein
VDDTRDPTQDGQTDVDEKISTASSLKEDSQRREDEGEDELADVTMTRQSLVRSYLGIRDNHDMMADGSGCRGNNDRTAVG